MSNDSNWVLVPPELFDFPPAPRPARVPRNITVYSIGEALHYRALRASNEGEE